MEQPVFTEDVDGDVTVDAFTPEMLITRELFRWANPRFFVRVGFREFEIRCRNGTQRYRAVSINRPYGVVTCKAVLP